MAEVLTRKIWSGEWRTFFNIAVTSSRHTGDKPSANRGVHLPHDDPTDTNPVIFLSLFLITSAYEVHEWGTFTTRLRQFEVAETAVKIQLPTLLQ